MQFKINLSVASRDLCFPLAKKLTLFFLTKSPSLKKNDEITLLSKKL